MADGGWRPNGMQGELFALAAAPRPPGACSATTCSWSTSAAGRTARPAWTSSSTRPTRPASATGSSPCFATWATRTNGPGPRELAAEHAAHYGLRHEVVYREIVTEDGDRVQQTLSEHIEERGMWPDSARRYCTSNMKRAARHHLLDENFQELAEVHPSRRLTIATTPATRCISGCVPAPQDPGVGAPELAAGPGSRSGTMTGGGQMYSFTATGRVKGEHPSPGSAAILAGHEHDTSGPASRD